MFMSRIKAVVILSERHGRDAVEKEQEVTSLKALYGACRDATPGQLVRVQLEGREGTVRLDFANFTPR
jgi:hypothetical protein